MQMFNPPPFVCPSYNFSWFLDVQDNTFQTPTLLIFFFNSKCIRLVSGVYLVLWAFTFFYPSSWANDRQDCFRVLNSLSIMQAEFQLVCKRIIFQFDTRFSTQWLHHIYKTLLHHSSLLGRAGLDCNHRKIHSPKYVYVE